MLSKTNRLASRLHQAIILTCSLNRHYHTAPWCTCKIFYFLYPQYSQVFTSSGTIKKRPKVIDYAANNVRAFRVQSVTYTLAGWFSHGEWPIPEQREVPSERARRLMSPVGEYERRLLFDCCLGLTSAEETAKVEALTAQNEQAADIQMRILAALVPLASLHPEPCPDELAECTVRLLCAVAQGAQAVRSQTTYSSLRTSEECRQCLSDNILVKSSS